MGNGDRPDYSAGVQHDALEIFPIHTAVDAQIRVPGSKSYTNRALVLAALAQGRSELAGALFCDDTRHMARALGDLGIQVDADAEASRFVVHGCGGRIPRNEASVYVGNSGTTARFLTAMLALGNGTFELDGNQAMRGRPIAPLLGALRDLGGDVSSVADNGCPPIRIRAGGLRGGTTRLRGTVSSQYFSALLLCAPYMRDGAVIEVEDDLVSKPYLDMTMQAMRAFGGVVSAGGDYRRFEVGGGQVYAAARYPVEADASAASYFFGLAAITGGRVVVNGLGSGSLQGDLSFVHLLERMGCTVRLSASTTEVVGPEVLRGIEADMRDLSDTAPTLAAVAALANGPSRITGIGFIRRKETDRIAAVVRELNRVGVAATEEADGLAIRPRPIRPAAIETYDDHRMAMSFALLGLRHPGILIQDPGCVAKTFPDYFAVLESVRHGGNAKPTPPSP